MMKQLQKLPRWLRLGLTFPILFLNGFLLALLINYLQPFFGFIIIASIIAFLLELLVQLLEQKGVKRQIAIASVLTFAIIGLIIIGLVLVPLMVQQFGELVRNAPEFIEKTESFLTSKIPLFERFNIDIDYLIQEITRRISSGLQVIGSRTLSIVLSAITSIANILIIIVLTIFLLIAGKKFWRGILSWIPSPWHEKVPQYLTKTFKDYFFVRLIVVGISSVMRLIVFFLLGVPYAILFAFSIGIAGFIPFFAGVITIFGVIVLLFQSVSLAVWFYVSATIIDQLTDNILAPRLMGNAIGLNPIWLLISLFIGGKVAGLLGIFLAVPLASVIKQLFEDWRAEEGGRKKDEVGMIKDEG